MVKDTTKIVILATSGIMLLVISIFVAVFIVGTPFFNERAHNDWHMNNYIVIPAFYAFIFFAFLALFLGGLFTGVTIPTFARRANHRKWLIVCFCLAIGLSTVGFNTCDMMLGCYYWPNGATGTPFVFDLIITSFSLNAWNFYFFCFIGPLWVSGFLLGLAVAKRLRLKF